MRKLPFCGAMLLLFAGVFLAWGQKTEETVSKDIALQRNLEIFNTITRYISEVYVDSMRPDVAFDAAIGAMLNTVDPYTEYYNSDETQRFQVMTTGSYGGIGSYILGRDNETYVSQPMAGSPAEKAGLKAGDHIIKVDSVDVRGKGSEFTTRQLKGDPGTMLTVTVERPYVEDSVLIFNIRRERVHNSSVPYYGILDGGIGYVKLTSFTEQSPAEVKTAMEKFRDTPEVKGVILDLRENGGGLVESAVEILGQLLPKGTEVLKLKGNDNEIYRTYTTSHNPLLPEMPLVVLINDGSASASEITAGAVQDLDRGILMGRRSFGKGLVQSTLSLPYDGLLKVTTAKYLLPSGRMIQALDYSRRNPDGSVARTPDSLTNEFRTRAGRTVRDGGGLVPDSVVEEKDMSRLLYNLLVANQIFDYATKYAATHPSIPAPKDFRITDDIYSDFVAFVDTAKIKSDRAGQFILDELKKDATNEGYMTEELAAALETLSPLLAPNLQRDLNGKRDEIVPYLGKEIVGRYYGEKGEIEHSLLSDEDVRLAVALLSNPREYARLLGKPAKKK